MGSNRSQVLVWESAAKLALAAPKEGVFAGLQPVIGWTKALLRADQEWRRWGGVVSGMHWNPPEETGVGGKGQLDAEKIEAIRGCGRRQAYKGRVARS